MPDVFVLLTDATSRVLSDRAFSVLSETICKSVATAWNLKDGEKGVSLFEIVSRRTRNAPPIQILVLASHTDSREKSIELVRDRICADIMAKIGAEDDDFDNFMLHVGKVESWVILPTGSWISRAVVGHQNEL